jgi:hypothetical protein
MSKMSPICLQIFVIPIYTDKAFGVYFLKLLLSSALLDSKPFDMFSKSIFTWRQVFQLLGFFVNRCFHTVCAILLTHSIYYRHYSLHYVSNTQLLRLQSVFNATARLVFSVRRSEHITPLLCELHWLRVPERIKFRLCVLAFRCLHGTAPHYLADSLHPVAAAESGRRTRSADVLTPSVPATRRSTLGDRAFPVAAALAWNSLPSSLRSVTSLDVFRRHLKGILYQSSFP